VRQRRGEGGIDRPTEEKENLHRLIGRGEDGGGGGLALPHRPQQGHYLLPVFPERMSMSDDPRIRILKPSSLITSSLLNITGRF
jgi:hypothetical protein